MASFFNSRKKTTQIKDLGGSEFCQIWVGVWYNSCRFSVSPPCQLSSFSASRSKIKKIVKINEKLRKIFFLESLPSWWAKELKVWYSLFSQLVWLIPCQLSKKKKKIEICQFFKGVGQEKSRVFDPPLKKYNIFTFVSNATGALVNSNM